jgi:uncharacterized membrane protein
MAANLTAIDVSGRRIAAVDALRGIAIAAMIIYHFSWDLGFFGFISVDVTTDPAWVVFARTIAATFIGLVGVSLVLADRQGFRPRPFLWRLAKIVAAALLVTIGTWSVFPEAFVFFGILHLIAFASVAALPFLWLPTSVTLLAGLAVVILPFFFSAEIFSNPLMWWVGLAPTRPTSVDYVPVFPWFGVTLFGVVAGRLLVQYWSDSRLATWTASGFVGRSAVLAGRWSLVIYLLHQLVLFGLVWTVANILLPDPGHSVVAQMQKCVPECRSTGHQPPVCEAFCSCILNEVDKAGYLDALATRRMSAEQNDHWLSVVDKCSPSDIDLSEAREAAPVD